MTAIEFGTKQTADAFRDEYAEYLCTDDDARLKTVTFSSDTPEHVIEDAQLQADEGRGERADGPGQAPLSDHERDEIDFSQANASIPPARSVKAIAKALGVEDWLAFYDPTLAIDEHREVMAEAATESGRRTDIEGVVDDLAVGPVWLRLVTRKPPERPPLTGLVLGDTSQSAFSATEAVTTNTSRHPGPGTAGLPPRSRTHRFHTLPALEPEEHPLNSRNHLHYKLGGLYRGCPSRKLSGEPTQRPVIFIR